MKIPSIKARTGAPADQPPPRPKARKRLAEAVRTQTVLSQSKPEEPVAGLDRAAVYRLAKLPEPHQVAMHYRSRPWLPQEGRPDLAPYAVYAQKRYADESHKLVRRLDALGLKELVRDPGVMARVNELEQFVQQTPNLPKDAWAVRKRFSDHLGTVEVRRGMSLSAAQANSILRHGMVPRAYRKTGFTSELLHASLQDSMLASYQAHVHPTEDDGPVYDRDPFVSTSHFQSVAESVTLAHGQKEKGVSKQIYVFSLRIPRLDTLVSGGDAPNGNSTSFLKRDNFSERERLVLYGVKPEEIVGVKKTPTLKALASSLWWALPLPGRSRHL